MRIYEIHYGGFRGSGLHLVTRHLGNFPSIQNYLPKLSVDTIAIPSEYALDTYKELALMTVGSLLYIPHEKPLLLLLYVRYLCAFPPYDWVQVPIFIEFTGVR